MASLDFTDIADVGSKDRDSGSFLVQVSGVGVTQMDVHIEQRPPRGTRTCPVWLRSKLSSTRGFELPTSSSGTHVRSVAAAYNDCLRSPQDHQGTKVRLSTSSTAC